MTICIAALCANRTKGIISSDRMITERMLSVKFEHGEKKYEKLSEKCVALSAGEALLPTEIFRSAISNIQGISKINEIANRVAEAFRNLKKKRIENLVLKQRGLTIEDFLKKQRSLVPEIAIRIDQQISTFKIGLSILLVGVDETGAHIFGIIDPGHSVCFDRLGFHAIGSGLPHALSTFISYSYNSSVDLKKAAYVVYEAKRNAEKAPGVGKELDMAIVDSEGVRDISEEELKVLDKAYKQRTSIAVSQNKKMNEIISALEW